MSKIVIQNGIIVNENRTFKGSILIVNDQIQEISETPLHYKTDVTIDADGKLIFPGIIDDQVHFRTPGLTHKGDIESESKSAVAGGVTSYLDMPNVNPPTTSIELLQQKVELANQVSWANFGFYLGATNFNIEEIKKINPKEICGVKIFMGSSTGNMLVDNTETLEQIFAQSPVLIAIHSEDESIIRRNISSSIERYCENIPMDQHPKIRSEEACYKSTEKAIEMALRHGSKLHILHISTAKEIELLKSLTSQQREKITAEVCIHHLWFTQDDYSKLGTLIKWNPAIKTTKDREALREAVRDNIISIIATDHAPHTLEEKQKPYLQCPSGAPMVQHSLIAMLELVKQNIFTYEQIVEKMCHAPARLFNIDRRGYLKENYFADITIVNPRKEIKITSDNIFYKCGWSPLLNEKFSHTVETTIVNGEIVYSQGKFFKPNGKKLIFNTLKSPS
ncbi:MAG TPA: dihydroorotase [Salinivirgaceae bacterium]|nr:dihydroorotase [Salinivirgaceae bacterium]